MWRKINRTAEEASSSHEDEEVDGKRRGTACVPPNKHSVSISGTCTLSEAMNELPAVNVS